MGTLDWAGLKMGVVLVILGNLLLLIVSKTVVQKIVSQIITPHV